MVFHLHLGPLVALVAGLPILLVPRLLSTIFAAGPILFGPIGLRPLVPGGAPMMN
jgi:hypothetical protein